MGTRLTVLLALLSLSVPALAKPKPEEAQAKELNEQAKQAFGAKRYDEAADLFLRVYDLMRTPTAVFNAARAREEARKLPEAKALFELYQRIERSPQGQEDAAQHLAAIEALQRAEADARARAETEARARAEMEARAQAEAKVRQELEARARVEAEARKAREEADAAARKALAEQQALERLKAEKAKLDAERGQAPLRGVTLLPPSGARDEEAAKVLRELLTATAQDAAANRLAPVQSVAAYLTAEHARGSSSACDLVCQLGVARSLGSAWAVSTQLREEGSGWHVRQVLWRTSDLGDSGALELSATSLANLPTRHRAVLGQLWLQVRVLAPSPQAETSPSPVLLVHTEPAGAAVLVDDREVGTSPLRLPLTPGWHRLRARKPGWLADGGLVQATSGVQLVALRLRPEWVAEAQRSPEPVAQVAKEAKPAQPARTPAAATRVAPTTAEPAPTATPPALVGASPPQTSGEAHGWKWGAGATVAAGAGLMANADDALHGDLGLGVGGHGFIGWSPAGPAWVALVGGLQWQNYLGLHGGAAPSGVGGWLGLLVPSTNLQVSLHRTWLSIDDGAGFHCDSLGVRLVQAPDWWYMAAGAELLLDSSRSVQRDEFGGGPSVRLTLDLGVNFYGAAMTAK
jgi:hypothetical protein